MATSGFIDSSDAIVRKRWEDMLDREVRAFDPILSDGKGLAGKGQTNLVQIKDDLTRLPGASVTVQYRYQLSGAGASGAAPLKNHEENVKFATDTVNVNILRHAVEVASPMYQQYMKPDILDEARDALADWGASRLSMGLHAHAAGISIITDTSYNLNNTISAMNSTYIIRPNSKTAGNLTSGDRFTLELINTAGKFVQVVSPKMRPAATPFGPRYCVFLHPEQVADLRATNSTWYHNMRQRLAGGDIDKNPIYTRYLGEDQGFLFFVSDFVPPGLNSAGTGYQGNTRRAWVGGAGALTLAFGRGYEDNPEFSANRWLWLNDSEDYEYKRSIAAMTVVGAKRLRFTKPGEASARENSILVLETYVDHDPFTAATVFDPDHASWVRAVPGVVIS